MSKSYISRGFTLLELLVVIAIIGVLSSIVLVSLNAARDKGNDVGVKANLATAASQAALYYEENGNSYGADNTGGGSSCTATDTLFEDSTLASAVAKADTDNGPRPVMCTSTATTFMVAAQITNGNYWCVDSTGIKEEVEDAPDGDDLSCADVN